MWTPSRRQLCLAFLLVCGLSAVSLFLHLHGNFFQNGLTLSVLCPDYYLLKSPVAMVCLPQPLLTPNASPSCPQHLASLPGTWTFSPRGRFGNQMGQYATLLALAQLNGRRPFILPDMHTTLAPVFRISLPVLDPEVDALTPWQHLDLHDWMSEEYLHLEDMFLKLSGFPCSWTFFHHLRPQIQKEFTLHDHLRDEAQHLQQAMDWFRARHEDPIFVVTSNGMKWCLENIDTSRGDVVFAGAGGHSFPDFQTRAFLEMLDCSRVSKAPFPDGQIWQRLLWICGPFSLSTFLRNRLYWPPDLGFLFCSETWSP